MPSEAHSAKLEKIDVLQIILHDAPEVVASQPVNNRIRPERMHVARQNFDIAAEQSAVAPENCALLEVMEHVHRAQCCLMFAPPRRSERLRFRG